MEPMGKSVSGTLRVSQDVIATIARLATLEINGVEGIYGSHKSFKNVFMKTENNSSAIRIKLGIDVVEISISIVLKAGSKAVSVAEQIQENVKSSVQSMTGVTVSRVNVTVAGIVFDDNSEKK